MGRATEAEAKDFAKELKWFLWNEVWCAVNACRAWSYSGDRHAKMLNRAAEDAKRSKEHLAAVDKKQAFSSRAVKHVKALAQAAGNEASRAVLTNGRLEGNFAQQDKLREENAHLSEEIGERGFADLVEVLRALSDHVVASLAGDKSMQQHKDKFDSACDKLKSIYVRAFDPSVRAAEVSPLTAAARSNQPRQLDPIELDERERNIWMGTSHAFRPKRTPDGVGKGRVSVVTPTVERRQNFHEILWSSFLAQDWQDKELIVVETYQTRPSEFLLDMAKKEPQRLIYISFERPAGEDWSIGLKRNIGASLATGEFIASFDDDDLYAPPYLTTMVNWMKASNALGATLSSWYVFDTATNSIGYANPLIEANMRWMDDDVTEENIRKWVYGYGFSYVYRRQVALDVPYDSIDLGEDYQFFSELLQLHGKECIALLEDKMGIALHTQHRANTARDYALWKVPKENVLDLEFSDFWPVFERYHQFCLRAQRAANGGPPLRSEDESIYEFGFTRSAPRRYREVLVHCGGDAVKVWCYAGATCSELLEALQEQHGRSPPENSHVFRLPPSSSVSPTERERWLQKVVKVVSPVAPPLRQLMLQSSQNEEQHRELQRRVRAAIAPSDRIGVRTTDLWISIAEASP